MVLNNLIFNFATMKFINVKYEIHFKIIDFINGVFIYTSLKQLSNYLRKITKNLG